jgi:hypothetical protein
MEARNSRAAAYGKKLKGVRSLTEIDRSGLPSSASRDRYVPVSL